MKIDHRSKKQKKHLNKMLLGTQNHYAAADNNSKGGTDFSIAAIMARGGSSREPSERSLSKFLQKYIKKTRKIQTITTKLSHSVDKTSDSTSDIFTDYKDITIELIKKWIN